MGIMHLLQINWGSIGIKALQFILSFSILVTLHELGHFLTARWFKCRVEKFYLFFNPWFSLWKKKVGDTEYGIGWVPFGGYVKISGMIDESMDKAAMSQPPQPWEFRSKPAWQRLIIMTAGVILNVLLAIVIFIGITWKWGDEYIPIQNLKYGIYTDSLGTKIGLHDGDKIIAVAGKPVTKVGTVGRMIIMNDAKSITVNRAGRMMQVALPPGFVGQLNRNRLGGFTYIRYPLIVDTVLPKAKIIVGTLQKGDSVIAFNSAPVHFNGDFVRLAQDYKKGTGVITVLRNGKDTSNATVTFDNNQRIFIGFKTPDSILHTTKTTYTFSQSIPAGFNRCFTTLGDYINNLKLLFTSKEVKVQDSLGSVFSIANVFPDEWDWEAFWTLTAIFSIILAFMNILPIPALDGGHALFTIAEMVTGRKPSDRFMEYAQMAGMVLLLGLMAYALGLDVMRWFK
jgi:regulator of sigma E protease